MSVGPARSLYRSTVLARGKFPRHRGLLGDPRARVFLAENPLCGDRVSLELVVRSELSLAFDGHACLLCVASTDLLAELVAGASRELSVERIQGFLTMLETGEGQASDDLSALLEVRALPIRVACVRLTWDVLLGELVGMSVDGMPTR